MQQLEEQSFPYASVALYGAVGAAGVAAGGHLYSNWAKNNPETANKVLGKNKYYRFQRRYGFGKNPSGNFWQIMTGYESYNKRLGKMTRRYGLPFSEDIRFFGPRWRGSNSIDRGYQKSIYDRNLSKGGRVAKFPAAPLFSMALLSSELEGEGFSGFGTAAATEMGAQAFGRIGMAAGGLAAYGAVEALRGASRLGRQWGVPELGGSFKDSQGSMTMRQRSLNAIRTSMFNVRSQLGNEALHIAGL